MKIEWKDFAKRRKLNLIDFINSMGYKEYSRWCSYRSVTPVDEELYVESHISSEAATQTYTKKELNKLLKAKVTNIAKDLNIDLSGGETKKELVSLILAMNNA